MELLIYWLIVANLIGFALMAWDKSSAEAGGWRITEATLITWSMIGGSLGALAASILVRHKTRKQPIATLLRIIPIVQILLAVAAWTGVFGPVVDAVFALMQPRG